MEQIIILCLLFVDEGGLLMAGKDKALMKRVDISIRDEGVRGERV